MDLIITSLHETFNFLLLYLYSHLFETVNIFSYVSILLVKNTIILHLVQIKYKSDSLIKEWPITYHMFL